MESLLKCYAAVVDDITDGGGANEKVGHVKHTLCHRVNSASVKSGGQICTHSAQPVGFRKHASSGQIHVSAVRRQTCRPSAFSCVAAAEEEQTVNYALSRAGSGSLLQCEALTQISVGTCVEVMGYGSPGTMNWAGLLQVSESSRRKRSFSNRL